ncbi:hypothetical protein SteCoe_384 [Stentor coeruleus]|uniref:Uncharacterized protein n=1 Tax=Stentor coeruleus TaxID=5963 RepID=A0A1R2D421_9CILI|nr:hypothetical protein SteCoe_384 [Stentor coeruleus]
MSNPIFSTSRICQGNHICELNKNVAFKPDFIIPDCTKFPQLLDFNDASYFKVFGFALLELIYRFHNTKYQIQLPNSETFLDSLANSPLKTNASVYLNDLIPKIQTILNVNQEIINLRLYLSNNPNYSDVISDFTQALVQFLNGTIFDHRQPSPNNDTIYKHTELICEKLQIYVWIYPENKIYIPEVREVRPIIYLVNQNSDWRILIHKSNFLTSNIEYCSQELDGLVFQPNASIPESFNTEIENYDKDIIQFCSRFNNSNAIDPEKLEGLKKYISFRPHLLNNGNVYSIVNSKLAR